MSSEESDSGSPRNVDKSGTPATESGSNDVACRERRPSVEERLVGKMLAHPRKTICLLVAVTLTIGFAALHSALPRVSKPPPARPFFDQSSLILDFYKGHLDAMVNRASDADLSFVMYYAPWDAESQAVRHEFESVAEFYYSRIFFAAINCWHPGSECRTHYRKIQSYPVLMLYPSRNSGIQYRGIPTATYMMRFLDAFLRPIIRITGKEQLARLLVEYDAVVVGFVDFRGLSVSPGYKEFYRTATRYLERDPNRDIAFAIVTDLGTAADEFGIDVFPSATLVMWNETLVYPPEKSWTPDNLVNWIGRSLHKVALWLQPPGVKSLTLAPYLRDGPVLFLFTPRNPMHRMNYNFNLIKELSLEYYSCGEVLPTENLSDRLRDNGRDAALVHREESDRCSEILNESRVQSVVPSVSVSVQQWINDSCCARVVINKCLLCKSTIESGPRAGPGVCGLTEDSLRQICKGSDVFQLTDDRDDYERQQFCCDDSRHWSSTYGEESSTAANFSNFSKKYKSSMLTGENDPRSANAVKTALTKDRCTRLLAGNKYHCPIFPEESNESGRARDTVSACKGNKTLSFIAIDSLQYFHFAEGLGIDILKVRDKTAVVILDADQESQYVMKGGLSRDSLVEFVNEYTDGHLQRTLRSESSRRFARDFKTPKGCEGSRESEICVQELTTDNFSKVVMNSTMDVVVMYHTPYCAFCSAVAYVYLTVARYLSKMDHLSFVRIDGDSNDLPWEYSMDRYPSILFFPAKRKEDSTVYPFSLPVTIPNLLNFVLANLDGDSHVEALVNVCGAGSGEPSGDCVARTRRLCLDIIEKLLRSYRKLGRDRRRSVRETRAMNVRREILLKLEHTREVHLILSSVDDLAVDNGRLRQIRQKFRAHYRNLVTLGGRNERIVEENGAERIEGGNVDNERRGGEVPRDEL